MTWSPTCSLEYLLPLLYCVLIRLNTSWHFLVRSLLTHWSNATFNSGLDTVGATLQDLDYNTQTVIHSKQLPTAVRYCKYLDTNVVAIVDDSKLYIWHPKGTFSLSGYETPPPYHISTWSTTATSSMWHPHWYIWSRNHWCWQWLHIFLVYYNCDEAVCVPGMYNHTQYIHLFFWNLTSTYVFPSGEL